MNKYNLNKKLIFKPEISDYTQQYNPKKPDLKVINNEKSYFGSSILQVFEEPTDKTDKIDEKILIDNSIFCKHRKGEINDFGYENLLNQALKDFKFGLDFVISKNDVISYFIDPYFDFIYQYIKEHEFLNYYNKFLDYYSEDLIKNNYLEHKYLDYIWSFFYVLNHKCGKNHCAYGLNVLDIGCGSISSIGSLESSYNNKNNSFYSYLPYRAELLHKLGANVTGLDIRPNPSAKYNHIELDFFDPDEKIFEEISNKNYDFIIASQLDGHGYILPNEINIKEKNEAKRKVRNNIIGLILACSRKNQLIYYGNVKKLISTTKEVPIKNLAI